MSRHPALIRWRGAGAEGGEAARPVRSVYSDPRFAPASEIVRRLATPDQATDQRPSVARRIQELRALTGLWNEIRCVQATVPPEQSADFDEILRRWGALPLLPTEPMSVLEIPEEAAAYLRGRRKQALRTNLRQARAGGSHLLRVPEGPDRADWNRRARAFLAPGPPPEAGGWPVAEGSDRVGLLALDASDELLGIAVARQFGEWAILEMMFRFAKTEEASVARFLLHVGLVDELRAEGVRHLIAGGAFRLAPGLQYLQHLLGYEPVRIHVGPHGSVSKVGWRAALRVASQPDRPTSDGQRRRPCS